MAPNHGFSVSIILLSLLVLCFALALCAQDPELEQCQHQCSHQDRFSDEQKLQCMKRCDHYMVLKEELQRGKGLEHNELVMEGQMQDEPEAGWRRNELNGKKKETKKKGKGKEKEEKEEKEKEKEKKKEEKVEFKNPYVFGYEDFTSTVETKNGRISVLQRFSNKSELLHGINNGVGFLEANPQTFISPAHFAADCLLFVAKGRASITMVRDKKRSFNLERGDIFMVPAGTPVYMTNRDDAEKLFIVKFYQPVDLPAHVEAFLLNGGKYAESFYTAFSWEVLEAAFNIGRDSLKRIFGLRQGGNIVKATKQQISALGPGFQLHHFWPFKANSDGPFNLLKQRPAQSNQFGKLYEARGDNYKPLNDLEVVVSYADIAKGAMAAAYFNSRATTIAFVVEGEGKLEMASPHTASSTPCEEARGQRAFDSISAPLTKQTAFVVPAGHPFVTIASQTNNLRILCLEINAKGNLRFPLVGRNNIVSQMDGEAKELSFDVPVELVDRLFGSQTGEFFFPGPKQERSFI